MRDDGEKDTDMMHFNRRHVRLGAGVAAFAAGLASTGRATGSTIFSVTIHNVATDKTLKLPDGGTSGAPIAPGFFVVSSTPHVLCTPGMPAPEALERLAEDGKFQPLLDKVTAIKGLAASSMFLPGQPPLRSRCRSLARQDDANQETHRVRMPAEPAAGPDDPIGRVRHRDTGGRLSQGATADGLRLRGPCPRDLEQIVQVLGAAQMFRGATSAECPPPLTSGEFCLQFGDSRG